jgi:hypothetical protein
MIAANTQLIGLVSLMWTVPSKAVRQGFWRLVGPTIPAFHVETSHQVTLDYSSVLRFDGWALWFGEFSLDFFYPLILFYILFLGVNVFSLSVQLLYFGSNSFICFHKFPIPGDSHKYMIQIIFAMDFALKHKMDPQIVTILEAVLMEYSFIMWGGHGLHAETFGSNTWTLQNLCVGTSWLWW